MHQRPAGRSAIHLTLLAGLAILPEGIWYVSVRFATGDFYQHEMALGQVTWMLESAQGGFSLIVSQWLRNFVGLHELALPQAFPLGTVLVLLAVAGIANPRKTFEAMRRQGPLIAGGILVAVVVLAFYASVGFIVPRLAFACIPPLMVATGAAALAVAAGLDDRRRRALGLACLAIAAGQSIFMIVKDGPYS